MAREREVSALAFAAAAADLVVATAIDGLGGVGVLSAALLSEAALLPAGC